MLINTRVFDIHWNWRTGENHHVGVGGEDNVTVMS